MTLQSQIDKFHTSTGLVFYLKKQCPSKYDTVDKYYYDIMGSLHTLRNYEPRFLPAKLKGSMSDDEFSLDASTFAMEQSQKDYDADHAPKGAEIVQVAITKHGHDHIITEVEASKDFIRWM